MKFTVQYPLYQGFDPRFVAPDHMAAFVATAEELGFDGVGFTDHPAPTREWVDGIGHASLDPLTALSYVAGVTSRVRLITYLLIVPYRNALLAAKQAATVDIVSGGRLTLAVGAGYLEPEFAALGVPFDERNVRLDQAVVVMRDAWRGERVVHRGADFVAEDVVQLPRPVQPDGPPIWYGGNSRSARRRAAEHGSGWAPLLIDDNIAAETRTAPLATPAQLRSAILELREMALAAGHDPDAIDVQVDWKLISNMTQPAEKLLDAIGALVDAGATWVVVKPPARNLEYALDVMAKFRDDVMSAGRLTAEGT